MLRKDTADVVVRRLPLLGSHSFTVIELDKDYFNIAKERIEEVRK